MLKFLILGATSPIARGLAMRFACEGAHLYLAARDPHEARRIADDLEVRAGTTALAGAFDAEDFPSHEEFLRRAVGELGGLDGVIVCFGAHSEEERAQVEPHAAVAEIAQNFTGAVSLITLVARHMEAQGTGFIIVIGSVAGERGRARNYVYGASKGALQLFTQGLRARLAKTAVHVMTVKLGTVDTRMTWGREGVLLSISPERASKLIYRAYRRKSEVVYVPARWRLIMGGVRLIPERQFKRLSF
jgi:decaprenylphospho-beta-D-erythro-pentofuranosid-2-ulose 2-reductase